MPPRSLFSRMAQLAELTDGQEADFFALMTLKDELKTRDGKPFFKVGFRDAGREVSFPIWEDSTWFAECRLTWKPGDFYKLRALYRETQYGPQLDIRRIRPASEQDRAEGFDPGGFRPRSRFDSAAMFDELRGLIDAHVPGELGDLVRQILDKYREPLLSLPAATHNHHAYAGGWLEHVLSVVQTCIYFAQKYASQYPDLQPPLHQGLVVAGGALHDIGKLRELEDNVQGAAFSPSGYLIGHILQGRDIVREAAAECPIDPELLLRLEHIIVSHQRLPEWGSPKPPMTLEALLVHYADDLDAKLQMAVGAIGQLDAEALFTTARNPLGTRLYRGRPASGATPAATDAG